MDNRGGLAVYVTSHGFGHLNRAVAVLNRIPVDIPLVVRCGADLFNHWRERLERPARFEHQVWDSGAVNPAGDSAVTDGPATLARAMDVFHAMEPKLEDEAYRLRDEGTAIVLCDVPPLPLAAAALAGVPGYAIANFTWSEIYAEHASALGDEAQRFVIAIERLYHQATAAFRAEPALPMREFRNQIPVGLVSSPGRDRRAELRAMFGLSDQERLVYMYVGRYGQADLAWRRLASYAGVHFVGFHHPPACDVANFHVVPAHEWQGADLMASTDAAVAKAGYGTVSEAMAAGTPLVFPPRANFAEHSALESALLRWGGGYRVCERQFAALEIHQALEQALSSRPGPPPFPIDGAERIATLITREIRTGRRAVDAAIS
jgi:hypothetical protein